MLKAVALLACVIGFVFIGPKALAEFRRTRPKNDAPRPLSHRDDSEEQQRGKRQVA
jgi:hypothetical protein